MPPGSADQRIETLLHAGRRFHRQGQLADAERCYRQALTASPENVDALYLLGMILFHAGRVDEGLALAARAVDVAPGHALARGALGQMLLDREDPRAAGEQFQRGLESDPDNPDLLHGAGLVHAWTGDPAAARPYLERAAKLRPRDVRIRVNLGNLLRRLGDVDAATSAYRHCISIDPDFAEAWNNLGALAQQQQRLDTARGCFETAIGCKPIYAEAHNNLGAVLDETGHADAALAAYRCAMDLKPAFVEAAVNSGLLLAKQGESDLARETLDLATRIAPGHLPAKWARCIGALSLVYASEDARKAARGEYAAGLSAFADETDLDDPRARATVQDMVGAMQPFQLAYQGESDLDLQRRYGTFVCRAMGADRPMEKPTTTGKLRVGIVSAFFRDHSNWKCPLQGWSRHLGEHVELHGFHAGYKQDGVTDIAEPMFHRFVRAADERTLLAAIREARLHCIVYPELGMHQVTLRMAARRLAPLQCTSWGHPETSGMPTMDWYLGSDLMEPEDGAAHYSERLIRLPGLSFSYCFDRQHDAEEIPHEAFGLESGNTHFLCLQNLSKYLPRDDDLLVRIVSKVPDARLVFIEGPGGATQALRERLGNALGQAGLDPARHLVFLPRLDRASFRALNRIGDVFLDTPGWSGCNSTLEALQQGQPVVTLPGNTMRSRHADGIYRLLGWRELVAGNADQYVDLAVALATDSGRRGYCRQQILERLPALEGNGEAEAALAGLIRDHFNSRESRVDEPGTMP